MRTSETRPRSVSFRVSWPSVKPPHRTIPAITKIENARKPEHETHCYRAGMDCLRRNGIPSCRFWGPAGRREVRVRFMTSRCLREVHCTAKWWTNKEMPCRMPPFPFSVRQSSCRPQTDNQGGFRPPWRVARTKSPPGGSMLSVRAWSENTAPPVATRGLLVVCDARHRSRTMQYM